MEMAYGERWKAEIAAMRRLLAGFAMTEECKWGAPTYTADGKNIVKAGLRMKPKRTSDYPVPEELRERFRKDARFKRAFETLTPGRQRSYLYHFAAAKQSATRMARIDKAIPAILEGRGFLERR
jgi:uncharacterized protein YdeI (YjbR/CyaY-like superfamily)